MEPPELATCPACLRPFVVVEALGGMPADDWYEARFRCRNCGWASRSVCPAEVIDGLTAHYEQTLETMRREAAGGLSPPSP